MKGFKKQLGAAVLAKRTRKGTNGNRETENLSKCYLPSLLVLLSLGVSFPTCLWERSVPGVESEFVFSPVLTCNPNFPSLYLLRVYTSTVPVIIIFWEKHLIWLLFTKKHLFLQWQNGGRCGIKVAASRDLVAM